MKIITIILPTRSVQMHWGRIEREINIMFMLKYIILILIVVVLISMIAFLEGCSGCQPEGTYERCLERGGSICLDIYPKCS
jgi:hypothetical protein